MEETWGSPGTDSPSDWETVNATECASASAWPSSSDKPASAAAFDASHRPPADATGSLMTASPGSVSATAA